MRKTLLGLCVLTALAGPRVRRPPRADPGPAHRGAGGQGRGPAGRTRAMKAGQPPSRRPRPRRCRCRTGRHDDDRVRARRTRRRAPRKRPPTTPRAVAAPAADSGGAATPTPSIRRSASSSTAATRTIRWIRTPTCAPDSRSPAARARVRNGFSLGESEVSFAANIDDKFYGQLTLTVGKRGRRRTTSASRKRTSTRPALPDGFSLRAGRFFSEHRLSQQPPRAYRQLLRPAAAVPGIPRQPVRRRRRAAALGRADIDVPRTRRRSCSAARTSRAAARSTAASARARCSRTPAATSAARTRGWPACRC